MMALRVLPILQVIVILCTPSLLAYPYPIYGTKKYGRSPIRPMTNPSWIPDQPMARYSRYPTSYYDLYPYSPTIPDEYYYTHDTYPFYPATSKYEVYQAVLPYYRQDTPVKKPGGYYGYDNDDVSDVETDLVKQAEREAREESQPIGHEIMYEQDDAASDTNTESSDASFLQDLVMSQLYKDAIENQGANYYDGYTDYYGDDAYGRWQKSPLRSKPSYAQEDEDVRELKQLAKLRSLQNLPEDIHWFQQNAFKNQKPEARLKYNEYFNREDKRSDGETLNEKTVITKTERKPSIKLGTSTTSAPVIATTKLPEANNANIGQKEEVLMRPATPVRNPFSNSVLDMMNKGMPSRKRSPSVYDTIKHMLDVEKSLENKYGADEIRPPKRKRIITNEESLAQQLTVLKKEQ